MLNSWRMSMEISSREVMYVPYHSDLHLLMIQRGWREEHCILADNQQLIKLTKDNHVVSYLEQHANPV
jgi:hypothetical protein